jgi:predicted aspartyl protease
LGDRATLYGRAEQVQKSADDLGFNGAELTQLFTIRALTAGGTTEIAAVRDLSFGLGARGTMNLVPATLEPTYGTRTPLGFSVFLRVRPTRMSGPMMRASSPVAGSR